MAMMAAVTRIDDLDHHFDDHPSVVDSLEDYEETERRSPLWGLPSQHSGFKSEHEGSEIDDQSSAGAPWSPPGFRNRNANASGWFRQDPYGRYTLRPSQSPSRSRQTSPEYLDAQEGEDVTIAANIPLPAGTDSPNKERSPEPETIPEEAEDFGTPEPAENVNNCSSPTYCTVSEILTLNSHPLRTPRRSTAP
jgi:hypothetical protein